jgi:hypothetical protein
MYPVPLFGWWLCRVLFSSPRYYGAALRSRIQSCADCEWTIYFSNQKIDMNESILTPQRKSTGYILIYQTDHRYVPWVISIAVTAYLLNDLRSYIH